jgi:hypothetical protein
VETTRRLDAVWFAAVGTLERRGCPIGTSIHIHVHMTYIHTYIPAQLAEGSRLSRNNGTLITQTRHTNAALEQVPVGVVSCVRPRRGSAPRATVMNVRPMGSVLSKSRSSCGRPETVLPMPALVRIRATLIAEGAEPRSACCLRLCQKCNLNQKTENWYCCQ